MSTVLPPPTAPELDGPVKFDPKVPGIWGYLLSYSSEEHKEQVSQQSVKEGVSVGYRHTHSSKRPHQPPQDEAEEKGSYSSTSSSTDKPDDRDPLGQNPILLGMAIMAAKRGADFPHFERVMDCILPGTVEQVAAFFTIPALGNEIDLLYHA